MPEFDRDEKLRVAALAFHELDRLSRVQPRSHDYLDALAVTALTAFRAAVEGGHSDPAALRDCGAAIKKSEWLPPFLRGHIVDLTVRVASGEAPRALLALVLEAAASTIEARRAQARFDTLADNLATAA